LVVVEMEQIPLDQVEILAIRVQTPQSLSPLAQSLPLEAASVADLVPLAAQADLAVAVDSGKVLLEVLEMKVDTLQQKELMVAMLVQVVAHAQAVAVEVLDRQVLQELQDSAAMAFLVETVHKYPQHLEILKQFTILFHNGILLVVAAVLVTILEDMVALAVAAEADLRMVNQKMEMVLMD